MFYIESNDIIQLFVLHLHIELSPLDTWFDSVNNQIR